MANQLKLLRKENKLRRACLKEENREMLDRWIAYAKASDINPYDFELCCKELIGIALQKEIEGKNLKHFFGEDAKYITENIIQGCEKKTLKDYLLFDLRPTLLSWSSIIIIFDFIFGELFTPLTLWNIIYYTTIIFAGLLYQKMISSLPLRQKLINKHLDPKSQKHSYINLTYYCIVLVVLIIVIKPYMNVEVPLVPTIVYPALLGIFGIALTILYKKYINKLAQERPWQDV